MTLSYIHTHWQVAQTRRTDNIAAENVEKYEKA